MSKQDLSAKELIQRIEMGKHDIKMRVRAITLDPIQSMDDEKAASVSYLKDNERVHNETLEYAESIMDFFSKKWRDISLSDEKQVEQMRSHLSAVTDKWIPRIKKVVSFYESCLSKRYYFADTEEGKEAMTLMEAAVRDVVSVCKDLQELDIVSPADPIHSSKYNLLDIIQEILDGIKSAYVIYDNEVKVSTYEIETDVSIFQNRVLLNIRENIEKHAFGTKSFKDKHVWEKKVHVSIKELKGFYTIAISNNGSPYKGEPSKIFDYGYCYGEQKNSGIGLNSALVHMQQLGGNIEFIASPIGDYPVTFVLKLPITHV